MRSRFRSLTALLALVTLPLLQAEAVWASACDMETAPGASAEMADSGSHGDPAASPMGGAEHSHEQDGPDPRSSCPLAPGGQTSCAGVVALPGTTDSAPEVPPVGALSIRSSQHARDLLLATALLRPPRA